MPAQRLLEQSGERKYAEGLKSGNVKKIIKYGRDFREKSRAGNGMPLISFCPRPICKALLQICNGKGSSMIN